MDAESKPRPGYLWSMFHLKCPRCRRGDLFLHANPYRKISTDYVLGMYKECPVCHQRFYLEPGFWFGTTYVSYAITVVFSGFTCLLWWLILGFSLTDNRLTYWLIANGILIIVLLPVFMRLSRWIFLNLFVRYNENYDKEEGVKFG